MIRRAWWRLKAAIHVLRGGAAIIGVDIAIRRGSTRIRSTCFLLDAKIDSEHTEVGYF